MASRIFGWARRLPSPREVFLVTLARRSAPDGFEYH
jgi:hypothetical protein